MEPVKGGMLVNLPDEAAALLKKYAPKASLASWAIRFAAGLPGVLTVLSGMSSLEQIADNTGYMQNFKPLTKQEQTLLAEVAIQIRAQTAIACTGCRYCTAECPKNIAIPDYFELYNNMKRLKYTSYVYNQSVYYANIAQSHGKASNCIECGICEGNCPQELPIRELLKKISSALE
jgi:predicted aldo/keto reductase-like oxidoreductase